MKFEKIYWAGRKVNNYFPVLGKIIKDITRVCFHCDIPYEVEMDKSVYFCHNAFGVVINKTAQIRGGG